MFLVGYFFGLAILLRVFFVAAVVFFVGMSSIFSDEENGGKSASMFE